jgi:poly(A) polymerase Pap1
LQYYKDSHEGRDEIKNLFLIDQADVEIIKLNFKGMFIDISIK